MMKQIATVVLGLGVLAQAASADPTSSIVGGVPVQAGDPISHSVVAILTKNLLGEAICTGSIIAPDLIITAAHCVTDGWGRPWENERITVLYGLDVLDGIDVPAQVPRSQVKGLRVYDGFQDHMSDPVDEGDVALIQIEGTVPAGYVPVKMLDDASRLTAGEAVTLAGYGIDQAKDSAGAGILRKVDGVRIVNPHFGKTEVSVDQSDGHGACHGDSGGPAYLRDASGSLLLWGLTDRRFPDTGDDDCKQQTIYTNVVSYRSWIEQASKELASGSAVRMLSFQDAF